MLENVELRAKDLEKYRQIVGDEAIEEIYELAEPLRGARVLHVNATAFGGGVAEMLQTLVPLMRDAGLDAEWRVIEGADEFFDVTKASHNGLQGMDLEFTEEMKAIWRRYNEMNAEKMSGEYDFIVIHDPQPAGLRHYHGGDAAHWTWRCHIDTSNANPAFWDFYAPYVNEYDAAVFTMEQYVGPGLDVEELAIITPTIDPLAAKNTAIDPGKACDMVETFGLDIKRPIITQVSRFDPWKDPLGVIDAYRMVKEEIPEVQLALVGSMASDDPEGWYFLDKTIRHAGEDEDITILHNYHGVGPIEVGAFQSASAVILQKSLREGFGLTVTEGLWKGKPVVGGDTGGITLQIVDGETGFLVDSVEACAEKTEWLLEHPGEAGEMGAAGRERVRENFLSTHHLVDYLSLFRRLESV
jgi:trehalose synthase